MPSLNELVRHLDREFQPASSGEDLAQWAVTGENSAAVHPDFIARRTGLMFAGSEEVAGVRTAVFVTDRIVEKLSALEPTLLVTHHNFDYYEDERGLQPVGGAQVRELLDRGHSVYVAHARLDTHPLYGTSLALAALAGIKPKEYFYDYYGAPTALVGDSGGWDLASFAEHVRKKLQRPRVTIENHDSKVRVVAVVAGGGDAPDLLEEAYDRGCDTMLMGTLVNHWAIPEIQEAHRLFLRLNDTLRLNLVGGSHFGTERPAMIRLVDYFEGMGVHAEYCEDEMLLEAE